MFNRQNKSFSLRALTGALLIVGSMAAIADVQAMNVDEQLAEINRRLLTKSQELNEVNDFYAASIGGVITLSQQNEVLFMDAPKVIPHAALVNLIRCTNGQPTAARIQAIINYRIQNGL